jgi:hypothetical protein
MSTDRQPRPREYFDACLARQVAESDMSEALHGWHRTDRAPGQHIIGDFIRAVLAIHTAPEARVFYDGYTDWLRERNPGTSDDEIAAIARSNIGWCYGEGMPTLDMDMWREVCGAAHPVFGTTMPSAEEAFRMGQELGEKGRRP